jgi:pyrrolidone-carboxylate peptidase
MRPSIATCRSSLLKNLIFSVAGRRRYLSVETRARNALSVLHPDVSGHRPTRGTIECGKPGALRGAAPFAQLLGAVRPSGFPALVAPLPDNRADFFLAGIGRARTIKSWQYRMNWIVN